MSKRLTQRRAILELLLRHKYKWVPLPQILRAMGPGTTISQYNARIFELRNKQWGNGLDIENKTQWENGKKHSWYRLNE
jgi:hypothetical protein